MPPCGRNCFNGRGSLSKSIGLLRGHGRFLTIAAGERRNVVGGGQEKKRKKKRNVEVEERLVLLAMYPGGRLSLVRGSLIEGETSSTFFESASCGLPLSSPSTRSSRQSRMRIAVVIGGWYVGGCAALCSLSESGNLIIRHSIYLDFRFSLSRSSASSPRVSSDFSNPTAVRHALV